MKSFKANKGMYSQCAYIALNRCTNKRTNECRNETSHITFLLTGTLDNKLTQTVIINFLIFFKSLQRF